MIPRKETTHIVIHHSLSKDGKLNDWKGIKAYHIKEKGWENIGYHFGIENLFDKYVVMNGRDESMTGAHCKEGNMNFVSLGICVVGNFDLAPPCKEQWDKAIELIKKKCTEYKIPVINVLGHGEIQRIFRASYFKSCPGFRFDMIKFRNDLLK